MKILKFRHATSFVQCTHTHTLPLSTLKSLPHALTQPCHPHCSFSHTRSREDTSSFIHPFFLSLKVKDLLRLFGIPFIVVRAPFIDLQQPRPTLWPFNSTHTRHMRLFVSTPTTTLSACSFLRLVVYIVVVAVALQCFFFLTVLTHACVHAKNSTAFDSIRAGADGGGGAVRAP